MGGGSGRVKFCTLILMLILLLGSRMNDVCMCVCVYMCIYVCVYVCMLDYVFVGVKMRGGEWRGLGYDGVRGLGGKYRRIKREVWLVVGFVRAGREKNTGGVEGRGDGME